jgi:hypothetical protein
MEGITHGDERSYSSLSLRSDRTRAGGYLESLGPSDYCAANPQDRYFVCNSVDDRVRGDPHHHQHHDGQQQRQSESKNGIESASSIARLLVLACRIAVYRRVKTCALRLARKITIIPISFFPSYRASNSDRQTCEQFTRLVSSLKPVPSSVPARCRGGRRISAGGREIRVRRRSCRSGLYFSGSLVRPTRGDMRDHVDSQESDHRLSHPFCGGVQLQSYLEIGFRGNCGAARVSTFSTVSAQSGHSAKPALRLSANTVCRSPYSISAKLGLKLASSPAVTQRQAECSSSTDTPRQSPLPM